MYRRYTTLSGKHLNCWYNALGVIEVLKSLESLSATIL